MIKKNPSLTESRFGCSGGHTWVYYRSKEGHSAHDRVSCLAERDRLVSQRAHRGGAVLQIWVFDGQPQEVQDALILRTAADVLRHLVPVVFVHLQTLTEI